jgi:hypothetical protein
MKWDKEAGMPRIPLIGKVALITVFKKITPYVSPSEPNVTFPTDGHATFLSPTQTVGYRRLPVEG